MRLSNLAPSIPATVLACLEAQGIRTDVDLLFSASTLDIFKRLPAGTATLEELADYTALAAEMGAASSMAGYELLLLEEQARNKNSGLHTGNRVLDAFLCGLDGRRVIELSGDKGSGKSVR
jgi:RAD51-like protein 3